MLQESIDEGVGMSSSAALIVGELISYFLETSAFSESLAATSNLTHTLALVSAARMCVTCNDQLKFNCVGIVNY